MARMSSATEEVAPAARARKPVPAFFNDSILEPPKSAPPLKAATVKASDDPVLADLESDSPTPVFTSYTDELAQPQIDRLLQAVGTPGAPHNAASPPHASTSTPVTTPAPQPAATSALPAPDVAADPAAASTPSPAPASTDSSASAPPQVTPTTAAAPPPSDAAKAPAESRKSVVAALPSDTELPAEKTAVILSSQGAEKRLIRRQPPVYPAEARKQRVEGTVVLKAVVSEGGKVEGVRLVEGDPTLAAAAISAVKQWHYRPYIRDGKARPFQTIVLVDFQRP